MELTLIPPEEGTVKPQSLMRWLVRLICPPGGIVLDPFAGSGSTLIACISEGLHFIGVDAELEYVTIANARIRHAMQEAGWETEVQEWECVEECPVRIIETQSKGTRAERSSGGHKRHNTGNGHGFMINGKACQSNGYDDSTGGASRFFTQLPPDSLFAELDEESPA